MLNSAPAHFLTNTLHSNLLTCYSISAIIRPSNEREDELMKMQMATMRKIDNFRNMLGTRVMTYTDITDIISGNPNMPSWTTLKNYDIIQVVGVESYNTYAEDAGDALLWNGWYQWDEDNNRWIIDHTFTLYGLA